MKKYIKYLLYTLLGVILFAAWDCSSIDYDEPQIHTTINR